MAQPGEWMEVLDEKTQRTFWYNPDTEVSTWNDPYNQSEMQETSESPTNSVTQSSTFQPIRPQTHTEQPRVSSSEWEPIVDENTKRTYYWNPITKESRWDNPDVAQSPSQQSNSNPATAAAAPQGSQSLPAEQVKRADSAGTTNPKVSNWVQVMDTNTKRSYWYNQKSGASQWTEPTSSDESSDEGDASQPTVTRKKDRKHGWERVTDPDTGRMYYYNKRTGASQWEMPVELEQELALEVPAQSKPNETGQGEEEEEGSSEPQPEEVSISGRESPSKEMLNRSTRLSYDARSTWEELRDPNTKRVFFFNRQDGRSQWERPDVLVPTLQVKRRSVSITFDPQSSWETLRDPETQQVFYFNRKTGVSQWECPDELENVDIMAAPSHNVLKRAECVHYDAASQWEKMFDPKSRREFFHNHKTGHLQWGVPVDFNVTNTESHSVEHNVPPVSPSHSEHPPSAWREVVDPITGRSFFFNEVSHDTRWVLPDDIMELIKNKEKTIQAGNNQATSSNQQAEQSNQQAEHINVTQSQGDSSQQSSNGYVEPSTAVAMDGTEVISPPAVRNQAESLPHEGERELNHGDQSVITVNESQVEADREDHKSIGTANDTQSVIDEQHSAVTQAVEADGIGDHQKDEPVVQGDKLDVQPNIPTIDINHVASVSPSIKSDVVDHNNLDAATQHNTRSDALEQSNKGENMNSPLSQVLPNSEATTAPAPLSFVLNSSSPVEATNKPETQNQELADEVATKHSEDLESIPPPPSYSPPPGLTEADWLVRWRRAKALRRRGNWEEMLDSSSGKVFYFSTTTSLGQFHPPSEFEDHPGQMQQQQQQLPATQNALPDTDPLNMLRKMAQRAQTSISETPTLDTTGTRTTGTQEEEARRTQTSDARESSPANDAWENMMAGFRTLSLPPQSHRIGRESVSSVERSLSPASQKQTPNGPLMAICLRSFAASEEGELSFAQGDVVTIFEHNELDRWWKAELNGISGRILPSHVRLLHGKAAQDARESKLKNDLKSAAPQPRSSPKTQTTTNKDEANASAKARMTQFTKRLERKQVEAQLVLLLRQLRVEPMKPLDSYPTRDKLKSLSKELSAMNLRNHKLKVEVRGLQWAIHQRRKGRGRSRSIGNQSAGSNSSQPLSILNAPEVDLSRSPDVPPEILARYGDMLAELRQNPQLLASIGACLNVEAQYIFASTIVNSLFDQYSSELEPLLELVQSVIDIETDDHHYRNHPWSADRSQSQPFLPALLAAVAQRVECQAYLTAVLSPVKEDLATLLVDTRARSTWGDLGGNNYRSHIGLPDAALRMVQVVFESMSSDAGLAQVPTSILRLCLMLNQVGGEVAVREFVTEVLLWPTLSTPDFYFGSDSDALDDAVEDVIWSRLDNLGEALQLMVTPPQPGSAGQSNSHSSAMRSRTSVKLLDALVDRLLSYRSVSAQLTPSRKPRELTSLVVVSCFDLYMLHLALDYYRARPHASSISPRLATILVNFGKAKPLHTGSSDNPYIIVKLPWRSRVMRESGRLLDDAASTATGIESSSRFKHTVSPRSIVESHTSGLWNDVGDETVLGISDEVHHTLVKARARLDSMPSTGLQDPVGNSIADEHEELLNLIQSYEAEIRMSMDAMQGLLDGVELAQVYFNDLLVMKSRLVQADSTSSIQIVPRLNEHNKHVQRFKSSVAGNNRLLRDQDGGDRSQRYQDWDMSNQSRTDETVPGLLSTVFNPLRLAEVDSETASYQRGAFD